MPHFGTCVNLSQRHEDCIGISKQPGEANAHQFQTSKTGRLAEEAFR